MPPNLSIENQIVAAIRRIIRAIDLQSRRLQEQFALTGPQLVTLQAAAQLGPVAGSVLAEAVHLSRPTVTGILDRLERRELINRVRDVKDRRSWLITVTEAGQTVLDNAPSLLQERFRSELSTLEKWEQTLMLGTLQRIASMMEANKISAAPMLVTGSVSAASTPTVAQHSKTESAVVLENGVSGEKVSSDY